MLDAMRKQSSSLLLKFLFGAIALVFIFWGFGTTQANRLEVAARVNDEVITRRQFERAYQNLANMYAQMGQQGAPPDAFLRTQAIGQLISTELMLQEAERLGLAVDEDELRQSIAAMPNFQSDTGFDKNAYVEILRQNGLKPSDFEELQRRQLLASKVEGLVAQGVQVSDQEVRDRFRYDNERVTLKFVRLPAATFVPQVSLTDEDVQKYYDAHQEQYREPERVRVQMLEFRPFDFTRKVEPTEAEISAYYETNLGQFQKPEEAHARHILFKVAPDASEADKTAAREQAAAALARAKEGADFAELAKELSQDATAENGGDLGTFGRGVMTPPFEQAAFALEPGQISDVVETQFGFHLIKLESKSPARTEPLEAIQGTIVEALKFAQARTLALEEVEKAHEKALDGTPLEQLAAETALKLQAPPPFGADEPIFGGIRKELAAEAFDTEVGEISEIVTETSGYTFLKVNERIPSAVPPLDRVREKIETDLRAEKASELAKARGAALLAQLGETKDLAALAAQENLTLEESAEVGRFGGYLPNLGNAPALKEVAFTLTAENPVAPAVYDVDGDAVVAVLAERLPPDDSRFETEKGPLAERLRGQAAAAAMRTFVDQLKAQAKIEYGLGLGLNDGFGLNDLNDGAAS